MSLQCCNQSVNVIKIAWNRVGNMVITVLTIISALWRGGGGGKVIYMRVFAKYLKSGLTLLYQGGGSADPQRFFFDNV